MILDLLDKLLSRLIDLLKETQLRHRQIHDDFVSPIYDCFEEVHAGYVDTFRRARAYIGEMENPIGDDGVESILREDSLFTRDHRIKLSALATAVKPAIVSPFVEAIQQYLELPLMVYYNGSDLNRAIPAVPLEEALLKQRLAEENFLAITRYMNILRSSILVRIRSLLNYETTERALAFLDECLVELQDRRSAVVTAYADLKNRLLDKDLRSKVMKPNEPR